jgi:hypothetical protein
VEVQQLRTRRHDVTQPTNKQESIEELLEKSKNVVAAMSPEEYAAMMEAQRASFVRAMTTPCEHGVLDFETCPKCRGWE